MNCTDPSLVTNRLLALIIPALIVLLIGCSSTSVRTTNHAPLVLDSVPLPEDQLLDIGIEPFNTGIDDSVAVKEGIFPPIREAEARYMPYVLMETLQQSGNWGAVRVIPGRKSETDLWVNGKILRSDGESLKIEITVQDAAGSVWFTKVYAQKASKHLYDRQLTRGYRDPFQGIYNEVANDILAHRQKLSARDLKAIRTVAQLKFARTFSPEAFGDHLAVDSSGHYRIERLPAENDPSLQRIERIRQRDYIFVDMMQDYYASFARQMKGPYFQWRSETYAEVIALKKMKRRAAAETIAGLLAIIGGIAAQGSNSRVMRSTGAVGIGAGAWMFKQGLDTRQEAQIHEAALVELGNSLNAEIEPRTIELKDRVVTLSGTVDDQYAQWRQILQQIYATETGQHPAKAKEPRDSAMGHR